MKMSSWFASVRFHEPTPKTRSAAHWLYALIVFCAMLLPGSTVGGVPLKTITFVAIGVLVLRAPGLLAPDLGRLLLGLAFPVALVVWLLLGLSNGFGKLSVLHFKDFVATYLTAYFSLSLLRDQRERYRFLFLPALSGLLAIATIKFVFTGLSLNGIPIETFVPTINHFLQFVVAFSSYDLGFPKLYLPSDVAICFTLFFLGEWSRLAEGRRTVTVIFTVMLFASCFLSISRFHWGALVVVAFVLMLRRRYLVGGTMTSAILFIALVSLSYKVASITSRYAGTGTLKSSSDAERFEQFSVLAQFFKSSPFLGHGLGSYTTEVIRSPALPYSYELQWVSTAGQIGALGMVLVLLAVWQPVRRCLTASSVFSAKVAFVAVYCVWLFSGLTNPYLLSTFGGVVFAMFLAFAVPPLQRAA